MVNTNPRLASVKNALALLKGAKDPQAMLRSLASQNPQVQSVLDAIDKSGGDPKKAFYETAKQMGVDPNQVLNMLK